MQRGERSRAVALVAPAYERAVAMKAYARQARDRGLEAAAFEIRLRAERRLGEMLLVQRATVGFNRGMAGKAVSGSRMAPLKDARPTLAAAGIDKKLSARSQRLATLSVAEFRTVIADGRERILAVGRERAALDTMTGSMEWFTKPEWIARARAVMGGIDLDPASCAFAQRVVRAAEWFDRKQDGLAQPWHGRIWINPPYRTGLVGKFIAKLIEERASYKQAVVLVLSLTETEWFQNLGRVASAVAFPKRRLVFYNEHTEQQQPVWGSAFFYIGARREAFAAAFADCLVTAPMRPVTPMRAVA